MRRKAAIALGNAICNNWLSAGQYTGKRWEEIGVHYSRKILVELKKQGFRLTKVKNKN